MANRVTNKDITTPETVSKDDMDKVSGGTVTGTTSLTQQSMPAGTKTRKAGAKEWVKPCPSHVIE